jgi:hypothetical protein
MGGSSLRLLGVIGGGLWGSADHVSDPNNLYARRGHCPNGSKARAATGARFGTEEVCPLR